METDFETALLTFLARLQQFINDQTRLRYPNLTPTRVYADPGGKKYVRIVRQDVNGSGRCVHCFIERSTGAVLKADGWKRPAKGQRGTIYADKLEGVTEYGAIRR